MPMPCVFQQQLHPPPHHPSELLSLSTPIHDLEPDTNFTSFFEDDSALVGNEACIPFVQIHTTDLQQQLQTEKSYRNAFRRKTAEIKSESELIKSEQAADIAAKERLNATPTPPTRNSSCPSVEGKSNNDSSDGSSTLHRCPSCLYLSLSQLKMQTHMTNCFGGQPLQQCPGCQNNFQSPDVLHMHLSLDHQLEEHEISALFKKPQTAQTKSRIFIKNVDCLREQQDFLPLSNNGNSSANILDLLEGVTESTEQLVAPPKPSQKISIKSVDVLREPALLPFDFQLPQGPDPTNNLLDVQVVGVEPERPRQPKIYIRNVDILKEPMLLPSALPGMCFNGPAIVDPTGVENGAENVVFQADTLLTPTGPLPGFEPSLAPLANMCSEAFSFDTVLSGGNGVGDSARFSALDLDFGVDFETEATPPPSTNVLQPHFLPTVPAAATQNQPEQKIFIKNVDILKAPQRGTLHLRTVDELNLMNRNEVEHLMVPAAQQQQQPHQQPPLPQPSLLEPSPTLADLQPSLSGSWPSDDGYDLAEDLECWPWIEEAVVPAGMSLPAENNEAVDPLTEDLLVKDFTQLVEDLPSNVPPLVPVTSSGVLTSPGSVHLSSLPVPPLVPLALEAAANEKPARIYVANNLLPAAVEPPLPGGTSVRGRPYGAKLAGGNHPSSKRRAPPGNGQVTEGGKCQIDGCMFRFKSPSTLEYHGRCHNGPLGSAQPMICPECRSTEFSNWNCLHTHLWRTHQIDMELYCCQLCSFKTPIYSRLVNTHAKIHSEERNYKCEQCGKGFKNTKQLKNHRRLHRTQGLGMGKPTQATNTNTSQESAVLPAAAPAPAVASLHRCEDCGAAFKQRKTLREHLCKERNEQPQCQTCQRLFSSKSSLKLHIRSHQASKRFKCESCDYEANDHNAFRRHLGTHKERKRYSCPHCDFRAIQSTAFRIHLQKRHPEQELSSIIYKCDSCNFSSINHGLLLVHQAKHEAHTNSSESIALTTQAVAIPSPIKVESNFLFAHSSTNAQEQEQQAVFEQYTTAPDALQVT